MYQSAMFMLITGWKGISLWDPVVLCVYMGPIHTSCPVCTLPLSHWIRVLYSPHVGLYLGGKINICLHTSSKSLCVLALLVSDVDYLCEVYFGDWIKYIVYWTSGESCFCWHFIHLLSTVDSVINSNILLGTVQSPLCHLFYFMCSQYGNCMQWSNVCS